MKRLLTILLVALASSLAFAQAPNKMSYQAVIRNASNNLVVSSPIGMRISILQGSPTGTAVYVETQGISSNANGLVSIEIGGGIIVSGNFTTIDWSNGPYFVKTETDPAGGTSYTITGTSQLLSMPYALYAKTAENVPTNVSAFTNDAGYLTSEVDGSVTNEIQTISRTGTTITLSPGGGSITDSVNIYTAGNGIDITGNIITNLSITVGDVKHGYQSGDHSGWYLLDGRALTLLPAVAQANAGILGISGSLPDATGRFLGDMGAMGSTGGSNSITLVQNNLPSVNFSGTAAANGNHNHTVDPAAVTSTVDGLHGHVFHTAIADFNTPSCQGWPWLDHDAMRTTDRREITQDNGNIIPNGAHSHSVDVATTTSSTAGSHTHTVTVASGGIGQTINSTPSYLSVNAFIYLGQ